MAKSKGNDSKAVCWVDPCSGVGIHIPRELLELPRTVLDLAVLDLVQGGFQKVAVDGLAEKGLHRDDAKKLVCPQAGGRSYLEVFRNTEGLLTTPAFGGGGFRWSEIFENFTARLFARWTLLGWSCNNGGGPGVMLETSRVLYQLNELFSQKSYWRRTESRVIQVILHLDKEKANGYGEENYRVWAIDSLKARTAMLLTLGEVLCTVFYPGGLGTMEELARVTLDTQLYNRVVTAIERKVPIILLDFKAQPDNMWCDPFTQLALNMSMHGCIGDDIFECVTKVDVEDPQAVDTVFNIQLKSAQMISGVDSVREWETYNSGLNFHDVSESLADEYMDRSRQATSCREAVNSA